MHNVTIFYEFLSILSLFFLAACKTIMNKVIVSCEGSRKAYGSINERGRYTRNIKFRQKAFCFKQTYSTCLPSN